MEEILVGMDMELSIANVNYDVEKAFIDHDKHVFVLSSYDYAEIPPKGKLVVKDASNVCAMDLTIIDKVVEEDKAFLTCEIPLLNFNIFKRNVLRIETEIPATYCRMEPDEGEQLHPLSPIKACILVDLSPQGCCLQVIRNEFPDAENYKKLPIYLKMQFILTDSEGTEISMNIIGKVVNIKRSWKTDQIGVLFFTKSYEQYHFIERYCNKQQRNVAESDDKLQYRLLKILKPQEI